MEPAHHGGKLHRVDLRFVDPSTERRFLDDDLARARQWLRYGLFASIGLWIGLPLVFLALSPDDPTLLKTAAAVCVTLAILERIGARIASHRVIQWLGVLGNGCAGMSVIGIVFYEGLLPVWGVPLMMLVIIFDFFLLSLRFVYASLSVAIYVPVFMVLYASVSGLAATGAMLGLILPVCFFMAGAAYLLERGRRRDWHLRQVVEAQAETIAKERARSEAILRREVRHQVAARSRQLGEVLARIDASLVVAPLKPGARFAKRYGVVRMLGAGGMGLVYEVEREDTRERLALKILTGVVSGDEAARFAREAEIGADVEHPHVIPIVDVGVASGVPYLVMELAEHGSLEDRRPQFGEAEWARKVLWQVACGLHALHERGIVHRDLKPGNVLFAAGDDGEPVAKISDFGLARAGAPEGLIPGVDAEGATVRAEQAAVPGARRVTATGAVLGTPFYMAPEAARGGRAVDAKSDVFAFGILACEVLLGRAPFETPPILLAMVGDPIEPSELPLEGSLGALLTACLAVDPERRPSMRELRDELG